MNPSPFDTKQILPETKQLTGPGERPTSCRVILYFLFTTGHESSRGVLQELEAKAGEGIGYQEHSPIGSTTLPNDSFNTSAMAR